MSGTAKELFAVAALSAIVTTLTVVSIVHGWSRLGGLLTVVSMLLIGMVGTWIRKLMWRDVLKGR
jgi:hypothetical protein